MTPPVPGHAPLAGLRVLDLSTVVAGPFGSEIMGYLGAEVIRVDPPSAAKPMPALPPGTPVSEADGFTWALQRNKRSICLDLKSVEGKARFLGLVRESDVVYENFRPGVMQRLGLDYAALSTANPRIVLCSISGFGQEGPWGQVGAYDVAMQALGGSMSITGTGEPGDIPCRLGMPIGDIAGSLYAVIGTLAAITELRRTGRGAALDIALLDAQLALNTYRVPQAFGSGMTFTAAAPRRGGAGSVPYGPFRGSDGVWVVIGVSSHFWPPFCRAMGRIEWESDPRFATLALRQAHQEELDVLIEARFREGTAAHWAERLVTEGVPSARVNQIHEAFAHPQATARGMLASFVESTGRTVHAAASPLRFVGEPPLPQRPPVATGADTEAVLAAPPRSAPLIGPGAECGTRDAVAALAAVSGPLRGILVVELCGDEPSGTFGTQILADLGATVVKVERPPTGDPEPLALAADGRVPEAVAYTFGMNRNKRSLCVDLKSEAGRHVLLRLVDRADVVYDNYKPGTLARLGLDAERLRARVPHLVCCSVSGYGHGGPLSPQPAYDATIQALAGTMSITGNGKPDAPPVRWGNPIGGIAGALYAVIGILSALHRRARTGTGATLDIALFDVQLAMQGYRVPTAMSGTRYAPSPHRGGNGAMPYGPFLAADGRWFVLGITSQFWPTACAVLGHPEWVDDPRLHDQHARQAHESELNALVGTAMRTASADEWQRRFVEAGIPGAKVVDIAEAFAHPHVALRGMLAGFDPSHPIAGKVRVAGSPLRFVGTPPSAFQPVPGLGAHTEVVLRDLLQLPPSVAARLRSDRAVWWSTRGEILQRPSVV